MWRVTQLHLFLFHVNWGNEWEGRARYCLGVHGGEREAMSSWLPNPALERERCASRPVDILSIVTRSNCAPGPWQEKKSTAPIPRKSRELLRDYHSLIWSARKTSNSYTVGERLRDASVDLWPFPMNPGSECVGRRCFSLPQTFPPEAVAPLTTTP